MGKQIKKSIKGSWHNVGSIESWLSDMALEGLLISDINKTRATFEQGDRTKAEYRIKYLPFEVEEGDESLKRLSLIELFGNYGWQEVCSNDDVYVFGSIDDENYKELPIFDFEYVHFKQTMNKEIIANLGCGVLGFLNLRVVLSSGFPSKILHNGDFIYFIMVLFCFLAPTLLACKLFIFKIKAKKEIDHHDNWKAINKMQVMQSILILTFIVAITFSYFLFNTQEEKIPLDDSYTAVIRLNDIEQSEESIALDKDSYIIHSSSFLAPEYYDLFERVNGSDFVELKEPYIYVRYYELRFEIFAQSLIKEFAHHRYEYGQLNEIESDFFDFAGVYTSENFMELYLSKGRIVISVDYRGSKTLDELLGIVEKKLASQYKLHNLFDLH